MNAPLQMGFSNGNGLFLHADELIHAFSGVKDHSAAVLLAGNLSACFPYIHFAVRKVQSVCIHIHSIDGVSSGLI